MYITDEPILIDEHLYLGNFSSAIYDSLQKNNISAVVCLTKDSHDYPPDISLLHIDDIGEDLDPKSFAISKLERIIDFIEQRISNKENVLVHCMAGACRSPTVIIAYMMKHKSWSVEQASSYVREKSSNVNPTFLDLLDQFYYANVANSTTEFTKNPK